MKKENKLSFSASPELSLAIRKLRASDPSFNDSDACRYILSCSMHHDSIINEAKSIKDSLFSDPSRERFSRDNRNRFVAYSFAVGKAAVDGVDVAVMLGDFPSRSVFLYCLFTAFFKVTGHKA